uniref:Ubiquitin-like protease family profile domain-containing protein n=1 Tax=Leersia perrieri TaxID=77586 RepID=A0A0D9VV62_9ORYZ
MPPSTTSPPAYRHHHRKRHSGGHRRSSSSRSAVLLGVRSFGLRLALAKSPPYHHRRLHDASSVPLPRRLRLRRRRRSVASLRLPIYGPFCLRYLLAAGALVPPLRRKSSLVSMGNFVSLLFGKSSADAAPGAYRSEVPAVEGNLHLWKAPSANRAEKDHLQELFKPLTDEEECEVNSILCGSDYSKKIIVMHESSNIEITKEKFWCLRTRGWLNDEVINLYLELLKERAEREPERFLKCHFFNTFFYKKLACGKTGYDYESVRRWTTPNRLGYELVQCEKIFVPVHIGMHWCLAIINMKDRSFQYLDSLGSVDHVVLNILARYIMDELNDKSNIKVDTSSWLEIRESIPLQQNGWDCGMFMLKFIDFHSRGVGLNFNQDLILIE